ncbi:hypothetical protein IJG26_02710 [Candidatus Saccharibacteria bacterium]|nr:hypothetical protein [Candidatus Saccharibacteria bacterium]
MIKYKHKQNKRLYMVKRLLGIIFANVLVVFCAQSVFASAYSLSVTTSGAQSINVSSQGDGTSISTDSVTVSTNCRSGYNFTVSTSVNDNNLYLNGDSTNNTSGTYFSPSDGTTALSSAPNTWGYYYNGAAPTTDPTSSSIFSAVPTLSSPASIKSTLATPADSDISDIFNIYYGVAVSDNVPTGTYKMIPDTNNSNNDGTIVYNVTMSENCIPITVHYNPTSTSTGTSVSGTGGTMADQEFYKDVAQNLTANAYTRPFGYEFAGWNTAQDGSGTSYSNGQSVTNPGPPGSTVTLYAIWQKKPTLYSKVAAMSKGTQTAAQLQAAITTPTTTNYSTDTSNSGVYEYNTSVFGASSDTSTSYKIYYYRGVLEPSADNGTYGSDGKATTYPNYVKLKNNTCWRIVRTTGSGGVKMIYNGVWGSNTCAKSGTSARIAAAAFGLKGNSSQAENWNHNANRVGYNFNNTTSVQDITTSTSVDTVFGSNGTPSTNGSRSNVKTYIEDTWYKTNMYGYTNMLENNAGYCNDRSVYSDAAGATALTSVKPYVESSGGALYFGAYSRNKNSAKVPSLACSRSTVDLFRHSTNNAGASNILKYPVALLTADEASFAGSGSNTASHGSNYNAKSFLHTGAQTTLLSPYSRATAGITYMFAITASGYLANTNVNVTSNAIRPVISLKVNTQINTGSGTATDPWTLEEPDYLYVAVAKMSKGTQTAAQLQETITTPTTSSYSTDTSNSGVYEYNASVFGNSSDASNNYKIYYYRGVLEDNPGTYGSAGSARTYPNYVKYGNYCFRIVRTTGSSGVKMIYNGTWSSNTCARSTTSAQLTTQAFGLKGNSSQSTYWYRNLNRVGYTFNNTASLQDSTTSTAVDTIFGANSTAGIATNNARSNIKTYIEDTWWANNMTSYTSKFEGNAGYCNDRTIYSDTAGSTAVTSVAPYNTTGYSYFGAFSRNFNSAKTPSLTCSRATVDRYRYSSGSDGTTNTLKYPVALLTADEAAFAGSGTSTATNGSSTNTQSFLRSGSAFWLLSPYSRDSNGYVRGTMINSNGVLGSGIVNVAYGVRPVVSAPAGATIASGSGTATDPWILK